MLQIHNLHYRYGTQPILNGIDLTIAKGDVLTILGANGAGKSTLLNCMAGLLTPQHGEIRLNGSPVHRLAPKQIAQKIAYVAQYAPQTYQYKVRDYITLGRAAHLGLFGKPSAPDYALVDDTLAKLNIGYLADKIYMQTSGGEKQLINIAKILVQQPEIILFDEPTSALDYGNIFKTLRLIRELAEQHFTIVMTSHNPDHPMLLHSRLPHSKVALLTEEGKLQLGSAPDIITEANLKALYHADLRLIHVPQLNRQICAIHHL